MNKEEIHKLVQDADKNSNTKHYKLSKRKLNYYINGGFEGLSDIYYNYMREQNISFKNIIPFESYINDNNLDDFFIDTVFFEVDNEYCTNVGTYIDSLCKMIMESPKNLENRKVEISLVLKRITSEIHKSAKCNLSDNPILFSVLKKIEHYYRIIHDNILKDYSPFILDNNNYKLPLASIEYKEPNSIAFKIGILFYTGEIKIRKDTNIRFEFKDKEYVSGNSLAKFLAVSLNIKQSSIKPYLNETFNGSNNDKNVFYSPKLKEEILNYCLFHQLTIVDGLV